MKTIFHRVTYIGTIISLVCVQVVILFALYLYLWPVSVIEVKNSQNLPIYPKTVQAGEMVYLTYDYNKTINAKATVTKQLICGEEIVQLGGERRLLPGKHITQLSHLIPTRAPNSDNCKIYVYIDYVVNPLKTVHYEFISEQFTVINLELK